MDISYTPTVTTFRPTPEQTAAIRRSGLRVTSLDSTHKVLSRVCKCGRVQEIEVNVEDTPRNRWEAAYAIERLSGDDWRCAVCRFVAAYTPETRGSGGGSGSKAHQDTPRRSRQKMTPTEKRIRQLLRAWRKCQDDETREIIEAQLARLGYKFAAVGAA